MDRNAETFIPGGEQVEFKYSRYFQCPVEAGTIHKVHVYISLHMEHFPFIDNQKVVFVTDIC